MPITPFLEGGYFNPETTRIMGVAFESARASLCLSDAPDRVVEIVARKIIELAKAGVSNPDVLCERALTEIGVAQPPRGSRPSFPPSTRAIDISRRI